MNHAKASNTPGGSDMIHSISAGVWQKLHELHDNGCRLDLAELYRLRSPIVIENTELKPKLPVLSIPQAPKAAIFVLSLRLRVVLPVTVARYELTADWLTTSVTCLTSCPQHRGWLCDHPYFSGVRGGTGKEFVTTFGDVPQRFGAGTVRQGLLMGFCSQFPFPMSPELYLPMTLIISDIDGYRFRFPVVLQQGGQPSSTSTCT